MAELDSGWRTCRSCNQKTWMICEDRCKWCGMTAKKLRGILDPAEPKTYGQCVPEGIITWRPGHGTTGPTDIPGSIRELSEKMREYGGNSAPALCAWCSKVVPINGSTTFAYGKGAGPQDWLNYAEPLHAECGDYWLALQERVELGAHDTPAERESVKRWVDGRKK